MIKNILKAIEKIIVSGVFAFAILNLICYFYYKPAISSENEDGSTDSKYEANQFYSIGTEGFGRGYINNDGFANMFDYDENMKIDVLVMGSSHMEAFQVDISQSTASQLNALLKDEVVYNIGMAAHYLMTSASNFRAALNKYNPTKYVVIETSTLSFSNEAITLAINEETPELPSRRMGGGELFDLLRRNPYIRLIKNQIIGYRKNLQTSDIEDTENSESDIDTNRVLLSDLLRKMSISAEEYGTKVIIAYHPDIDISSDGTMNIIADQDKVALFKKLCEDNGMYFLDMSDRFREEYEKNYVLPYGFFNSSVGTGHLNKYGHAMMADELYDLISEAEQ